MASSRDAFRRFRKWKKSRTVLNLTVVNSGGGDTTLQGAIFFADEDEGIVGFVDDASRNHVSLNLSGDVSFRIETRSVEADCRERGRVTFVEVLLV